MKFVGALGLIIDIFGAFLLSVEAIKPPNLAFLGVHPSEWTGGGPENRLTEPGFRGESPWLSTARIRSSSSGKSSRTIWPARPSRARQTIRHQPQPDPHLDCQA